MTGLSLALLLTMFVDIAVLVVPVYDMQLYDRVLQSRNMDTLAVLSVACLAGLLLYAATDYLRSACLVAMAEGLGRRLSGLTLQEGIRRASVGDSQAAPGLVRDLNEVLGFLSSGAVVVPLDALCAPLFLAVLYRLHPAFFDLALAGIAALVLAGIMSEWLVRPRLLAGQAERAAAAHALAAGLAEPAFAEGLGMLPALCQRWAERYRRAMIQVDAAGARALGISGVSRLVRLALQAAVMAVGALLILSGEVTPGSLMGANLLLNKVLGPFENLVSSGRQWATARAAWQRIGAIRSQEAPAAAATVSGLPGLLVQAVHFSTPAGQLVLKGIGFHAPPGALVAVTGANGAGKSTLLRVLAGVVPPTEGSVSLNGMPVHGGAGVGFLPPTVALLDGSIGENIARFGSDGSSGSGLAVAAASAAGVHERIGRMARGYETPLQHNGASLSGGMRQRIGLARALHGAAGELLVLDEPDASLDGEGTAALLGALRERCARGGIVIVTSHRPALRDAASLVLMLRDGTLDLAEADDARKLV